MLKFGFLCFLNYFSCFILKEPAILDVFAPSGFWIFNSMPVAMLFFLFFSFFLSQMILKITQKIEDALRFFYFDMQLHFMNYDVHCLRFLIVYSFGKLKTHRHEYLT